MTEVASVPAGAPRRLAWRVAEVVEASPETPRTKSISLTVPGWEGHRAGQHVDVRLTAEDGYQAQRSYSIASAPENGRIELLVKRLEDGEVSQIGTVIRCAACDNALIRVARQDDGEVRYYLDLKGVEYLRIEGATRAPLRPSDESVPTRRP